MSEPICLHMDSSRDDEMRAQVGSQVNDVLAQVELEVISAMTRFASFNSAHEGYAVILEELDEMWDDIKANRVLESTTEALQVAAMAVRYLVDIGAKVTPSARGGVA